MYFALLTLLSSLSLAAVAGWFSIVGFMAIYAGAPLYALVMGVVMEGAKLVTASWLYRNWHYATWKLKLPLLYFMVALMVATSIGVFGFLSKAHLEQTSGTLDNTPRIEQLNYQLSREQARIADNDKIIAQLDATVNSFLGKEQTNRSITVRRSQQAQRQQLKDDTAAAQKAIDEINKEKFALESEVRKLELEVGPIRYIAELFYGVQEDAGKNIEAAVRIFTLLLVSTLDPLAVILLIAANNTLLRLKNEKEAAKKDDITAPVGTVTKDEGESEEDQSEVIERYSRTTGSLPEESAVKEERSDPVDTLQGQEVVLQAETQIHVPLPEVTVELRGLEPVYDLMNPEKPDDEELVIKNIDNFIPELPKNENFIGARSPTPTAVIDVDNKPNESESITSTPPKQVWAQHDSVLRELIGNSPHFIPQKVNEPEIVKIVTEVSKKNKYPVAMSWLDVFKKDTK